jgi:hypothetical protein
MSRLSYIFIAFITGCSLIMGSCGQKKAEDQVDLTSIETEVRQVLEEYFKDMKAEGLSSEFRYLDESDDFFWVPPGYASALTYDSVKTIITQMSDMFTLVDNQWVTLQVNPLNHELAAYTGQVHSIMTDTAGTSSEHDMLETGVMIKREDGWKILCGQSRMTGNE